MSDVAVFGIGYVGCVTAACMSRDGHRVVGVDIDAEKVAALNAGRAPVSEPGLAALVFAQVKAGRLSATTNVRDAVQQSEIALIAVGTPSREDGSVDVAAVERVVESIGCALRRSDRPYTIVIRSTLLPGFLEQRLAPRLNYLLGSNHSASVALCNNPEFLREGSAIRDYDAPPFVLIGAADPDAADAVRDLYAAVQAETVVTDTRTAALVKYACNAFHALKVAFANEIGVLASSLGADGHEVMQLVCRDRKLNVSPAYLRPGFAFGGSCLPKDVRALVRHAEAHALRIPLVSAILPSNSEHLARAVRMVEQFGCRRVGLVGLSFKPGTDDLRESPQVLLAQTLLGRGYDLRIFDPAVRPARLTGGNLAYVDLHLPHLAALLVRDADELLDHAELLVLTTDLAASPDPNSLPSWGREQGEGEAPWQTRFTGEVLDLRLDLARQHQRQMAVAQ